VDCSGCNDCLCPCGPCGGILSSGLGAENRQATKPEGAPLAIILRRVGRLV
jgi:hypothetical protein